MALSPRQVVRSIFAMALVCAAAMPPSLYAAPQTTTTAQSPAPAAVTPVRLKIVVDRTEGDKPVVSIPFEVVVRANTSDNTSLNHGRSVPVPQTTFLPLASGGAPIQPQISIIYQSIGSNLNIRNVKLADRVLTFELMVDVSYVEPTAPATVIGNPTFRKFSMQLFVTARLGETAVVAASSDKMTNETAKLSVFADLVR